MYKSILYSALFPLYLLWTTSFVHTHSFSSYFPMSAEYPILRTYSAISCWQKWIWIQFVRILKTMTINNIVHISFHSPPISYDIVWEIRLLFQMIYIFNSQSDLLRYDVLTIKCTNFKCTLQWVSTNAFWQIYPCNYNHNQDIEYISIKSFFISIYSQP